MKIAILNITAGGMSGGHRKYLKNILPRLNSHSDIKGILCISPEKLDVQSWFPELLNVEFMKFKAPFLNLDKTGKIKEKLKKFSPDVLFIPMDRYVGFMDLPVVNMVRNMEPLSGVNKGNPMTEKIRNYLRTYCSRAAVKRANRIIAVSDFVKKYLTEKWNIPEGKISVVHHGVNPVESIKINRPAAIPLNWEGEFFFTAGSIRPARGLEDIFRAVAYAGDQEKREIKLVVAGGTSPNMRKYQQRIRRISKESGLLNEVCWTEELDEHEMSWCYQKCRAFIMASKAEACPNVALEAMANGSVSISTDISPMPEIFGDTATYYSPRNVETLYDAIKAVVNINAGDLEGISQRAKKRASDFSWDVCAEKTVKELREAYES